MSRELAACRQAWRLWRSESRAESAAALVLVGIVVGPVVVQMVQQYRRAKEV